MTDFANLRALLAGASPEPWFTHPHDVPGEPFPWSSSVFWTGGAQDAVPRVIVARADNPDATLIVEAVNALPGLLDELERLRAALAPHLRDRLDKRVSLVVGAYRIDADDAIEAISLLLAALEGTDR